MAKKKSTASDPSISPASASAPRKRTSATARSTASNGGARSGASPAPSHDEIAEAAYHRYLSRQQGTGAGTDFDDWVEAERDLRTRSTPKSQ